MPSPANEPATPGWLSPAAQRGFQLLLAVLAVVIAWLAFSPAPPKTIDTGWDKSNHLLAFATLAAAAQLAFWPRRRRVVVTGVGLLVYGAFIELVQSQLPRRSGEWADLLADAVGIALGLLLVRAFLRR